jgi:hypothetical protein
MLQTMRSSILPACLSTAISSSFKIFGWQSILSSFTSRSAVIGNPSFSLCIRIFFSAKTFPERLLTPLDTTPKVPSPSFSFMTSYSLILAEPRKRRCVGSVISGGGGAASAMFSVRVCWFSGVVTCWRQSRAFSVWWLEWSESRLQVCGWSIGVLSHKGNSEESAAV